MSILMLNPDNSASCYAALTVSLCKNQSMHQSPSLLVGLLVKNTRKKNRKFSFQKFVKRTVLIYLLLLDSTTKLNRNTACDYKYCKLSTSAVTWFGGAIICEKKVKWLMSFVQVLTGYTSGKKNTKKIKNHVSGGFKFVLDLL